MMVHQMIRDAARVAVAGWLVAGAVVVGCLGGESRAREHAEQARSQLEAGHIDAALIELNSALKLAPDDAKYPEQIARVLLAIGDPASAKFYLGEAYRLDPTRESSAVALAQLLLQSDPAQADALLSEVLDRNPDSAWGMIGRAEQALVRFDVEGALAAALLAVELEPELAEAHWHLARVHEARIRERMLSGESTEDQPYRDALVAISRFGELDPTRRWQELAERARLLAAWPDHQDEAESAIREASRRLGELKLATQENEILDLAIELGRSVNDLELERWALERKVELAPRNYPTWESLAELTERQGTSSRGVYLRLIEALPTETEPQIRFARLIQRTQRPLPAVDYLRRQLGKDFDDAAILAEIARIHLGANRPQQARATLALLQSQHPEARETQLMVAWTLMEAGRADQALERLAVLDWTHDHAGAQRLLSDLYLRAGDLAASLQTLDRAIGLASHPDSRSQRTRAGLLYELGRYREARVAYRTLSRMASLRPSDRALLAQCYIETGGRAVGIRMLESLVDMPSPPEAAVHELFVREGGAPEQRERLRGAFAKLLAPKPNHPGVLDALARFEIAAGSPARARPPIEASHALAVKTGAPTGRLGLLLARLDAADGQTAEARERVLAILDDDPTVPGVLGFAVSLYPTKDDALATIRELTRKVPNREVPASHHALLARLYHQTGNSVMARWSYEQALTGGLDLPILKNDLAFLLAQQGHDLPRARLLARQAVQSLPNEPGAIDTLGFVLLELEDYANAADQFRSALELAQERGLPQATIQYHLGLALAKLQRFFEAEQAFMLALDLGEGFSDEAAAKHQLAILRGEI